MAEDDHLATVIPMFGSRPSKPLDTKDFRRTPREAIASFRIRVDLDDADPPIWRRLDLRSDLTLDLLHQVMQVAFSWTDSHLHRFSIGGRPFRDGCQQFIGPYDEDEGDGSLRASEVRLDETVQDAGDILYYVYDYGDNWELTLRLDEILPAGADTPTAIVVDGQRAAPPEDCGHVTDAAGLADIIDDPERFALDELNTALRGPYFRLRENGFDPRLIDLVSRLRYTGVGAELNASVALLVSQPTTIDRSALPTALRAHRWFLDRANDGGIPLTAAGYLKPADVAEASKVVPAMSDWIGTKNREVNCAPLLHFRESLQSMGLLRKHKGTLVLTRAGAKAQRDPMMLWKHLAARLIPGGADFEAVATLLLLVCAGTSISSGLSFEQASTALSELGWRHGDGRQISAHQLYWLAAFDVLKNISDQLPDRTDRRRISPHAATLARAALRG